MKVAIITGASRGVGAAVAEGLAKDNYRLALMSRNILQLEEVASRIAEITGKLDRTLIIPTDVTSFKEVRAAVAKVIATWGRIDVLFNNAGIFANVKMESPVEDFDKELAVNLAGAFYVLHEVIPQLKKQGSGHIINLSSRTGRVGFAHTPSYSATKFGLVGLNESLYRELCPLGIKVTALCPSWMPTAMGESAPIPDSEKIQLEDIVSTVRYLLSLTAPSVVREIMIECRKAIW